MPNVPADKLIEIAKALLIAAGASEEEEICELARSNDLAGIVQ